MDKLSVQLVPALHRVFHAVVKNMPGGPVSAAAHHRLPAHIVLRIAVIRGFVIADINADVPVNARAGIVIIRHGQCQAVNVGNSLADVVGKNAVVLHLAGGAAPAVTQGPCIGEIGVEQASTVRTPGIAHRLTLAAGNVEPAVPMGLDAVGGHSQRSGRLRGGGALTGQQPGGTYQRQYQKKTEASERSFFCQASYHG